MLVTETKIEEKTSRIRNSKFNDTRFNENEWCKTHFTKPVFGGNDQVKEDEVGGACSSNGEKRNAYRLLVGKPEGKRPVGRPRHRWVDNIKICLVEI
jgi:hypothetical protein